MSSRFSVLSVAFERVCLRGRRSGVYILYRASDTYLLSVEKESVALEDDLFSWHAFFHVSCLPHSVDLSKALTQPHLLICSAIQTLCLAKTSSWSRQQHGVCLALQLLEMPGPSHRPRRRHNMQPYLLPPMLGSSWPVGCQRRQSLMSGVQDRFGEH